MQCNTICAEFSLYTRIDDYDDDNNNDGDDCDDDTDTL